MAKTIFFSWQADIDPTFGRRFLREALEEACKGLGDNNVAEAQRDELIVESDTEGKQVSRLL